MAVVRVPKAVDAGALRIRDMLDTGSPYSELTSIAIADTFPLDCFNNVQKAISQKGGGSIVYGWQIWETLPGVMMEAEFHAVWQDPQGAMHDVTPHLFGSIERILFLPDPVRAYRGKQVCNLRIALVQDKLVEQFIKAWKLRFKILNEGNLAYEHGIIAGSTEMQQRAERVSRRLQRLEIQIKKKYFLDDKT